MELLLLVLIAGLVGYWLSRSRFSKSVDQAAGKVSETSRDAAGRAGGWFRGLFGGGKAPADEVLDAEFEDQADEGKAAESETAEEPEEVKPAKKTASRRKKSTSAAEDAEPEG